MIEASDYSSKVNEDAQKPGLRDPFFLVLFLVHVVVVIYFACDLFSEFLSDLKKGGTDASGFIDIDVGDAERIGFSVLALVFLTLVLSSLLLSFMIKNAQVMITTVLTFNIFITLAMAILSFIFNVWPAGFLLLFISLINWCYYRCVKSRIPFASANLAVACRAIDEHKSVVLVAYGVVLKGLLWTGVWLLCTVGVMSKYGGDFSTDDDHNNTPYLTTDGGDDSKVGVTAGVATDYYEDDYYNDGEENNSMGVAVFFLLLSFYWGNEVIRNICHVTTAGVVASWWYNPPHNQQTSVVSSSYCRATTTSLGSIAFGSLIVAVIQALKSMAEKAEREGNAAACCARCILQCFEDLMSYFNRWAFVYVGIYGDSFLASGKAVMKLFKNRGLTAVVNDQLIGNVLAFSSLVVGGIVGGVGALIPTITGSAFSEYKDAAAVLGITGFLIGFCLTLVLTNVVDSGVATVFVCYAEGPQALERSRPELFFQLFEAWRVVRG